jgi:hypothetical protein
MTIWNRGPKPASASSEVLNCSFCKKSQQDVKKLIAGPNVYICDECVDICNHVLAENILLEDAGKEPGNSERAAAHAPIQLAAGRCSLCHCQFPTNQLVLVPERGAVCPACGDAVRAVLDEDSAP